VSFSPADGTPSNPTAIVVDGPEESDLRGGATFVKNHIPDQFIVIESELTARGGKGRHRNLWLHLTALLPQGQIDE
jgi:hypothetical protein